jgi:hypothetical protein
MEKPACLFTDLSQAHGLTGAIPVVMRGCALINELVHTQSYVQQQI